MGKFRAGLAAASAAVLITIAPAALLAQGNLTLNGIAEYRQNAFAFTNANIYRANGEVLGNGTLLIGDGRVVEVRAVGTLEAGKNATLFISSGDALDMRTSQILGAYIQGRDIDLFGT